MFVPGTDLGLGRGVVGVLVLALGEGDLEVLATVGKRLGQTSRNRASLGPVRRVEVLGVVGSLSKVSNQVSKISRLLLTGYGMLSALSETSAPGLLPATITRPSGRSRAPEWYRRGINESFMPAELQRLPLGLLGS